MRNLIPMMIAFVALNAVAGPSANADTLVASMSPAQHAASMESIIGAIRVHPSDLSLRRQLAQVLIQKGLTVKAAETIKQVMAVGGQNAEDLTLLGDASRYSGDVDRAIASYKGALTLSPMDAKAWSGLSLSYAAKHDFHQAEQVCAKAMSQITAPSERLEIQHTLVSVHSSQSTVNLASNGALQ